MEGFYIMFKCSNKSQSPMLYSILEILESGNQMGVTPYGRPEEVEKKVQKPRMHF